MAEREDRKFREVAVGRYGYRHEAEFAAGFLHDAGIPYRLQVDDPSLGMTLSTSAIVWVHAADQERAREILETSEELREAADDDVDAFEAVSDDSGSEEGERRADDALADLAGGDRPERGRAEPRAERERSASDPPVHDDRSGRGVAPSNRAERRSGQSRRRGRDERSDRRGSGAGGTRGTGRHPTAATIHGTAPDTLGVRPRLLALVIGAGSLSLPLLGLLSWSIVGTVVGVVGALLTLVALVGRAPEVVRRTLSTLSGDVT